MFVIPFVDNQLFYLKVIIALLLLVSLHPSSLFPKVPTGSQRHVDIHFQIHQAVIPSAPLFALVFAVAAFFVFPGTSLLEPSVLFLRSGCGLICSPHNRTPLPPLDMSAPQLCCVSSVPWILRLPVFCFTPLFPWSTSCSKARERAQGKSNGRLHIQKKSLFCLHIGFIVGLNVEMQISLRISKVLLHLL